MNKNLSEFLSYGMPWESFRTVDLQEFFAMIGKTEYYDVIIKSQHKAAFEEKFLLYARGMQVLHDRYEFFSKLLEGNDQLWQSYGTAIGGGDLRKRLLFSMHHCFARGRRLLRTYNDLLGNYPEYLRRVGEMLSRKDSDCRGVTVCLCKGAKPPFMSSCMSPDLTILLPHRAGGAGPATQKDIDKLFG
ncbi:MAG TPA: hypothetical protein VF678_14685 [bacterium]